MKRFFPALLVAVVFAAASPARAVLTLWSIAPIPGTDFSESISEGPPFPATTAIHAFLRNGLPGDPIQPSDPIIPNDPIRTNDLFIRLLNAVVPGDPVIPGDPIRLRGSLSSLGGPLPVALVFDALAPNDPIVPTDPIHVIFDARFAKPNAQPTDPIRFNITPADP